jgi:MinD-like ATPase involved in chromosome partitioning or flagellar assembly
MRVPVLCAVPGPVEARLVAAIDAPGTGLQVVRRCADLAEVVALALAGVARCAVLAGDLRGLDRAAVARLAAAGVGTVLLAGEDDAERCAGLGALAVVGTRAPVQELVAAVRAVVGGGAAPGDAAPRGTDGVREGPGAGPDGRLVAVWGPAGAPGRTTIAANLAAELAHLGESALLVDADTWGGCVAQALGLLDESAGLAAAARAAGNGVLDRAALARLCPEAGPGFRVLTGLSRPDRWREVPRAGLDVVWTVARELAAWTVADCGAPIEDEAGAGFEAMLGPRRNDATLSALAAADVAVVVGAGEPVGVQRLVQGLAELAEAGVLRPDARRVVLVNRVRASAAGPAPEHALASALSRYAGVQDAVMVPDDRAGTDRAMLTGTTLREAAPQSPARVAITALAADLAERPVAAVPRRAPLLRRAAGR